MKLRFLQVEGPEKKKRPSLFQLARIKKIKKRNLVIAGIILLILILFAGSRIAGEVFKDNGLIGGKSETAQEEPKNQEKETEQKETGKEDSADANSDEGAAEAAADVALIADLENRLATDFIKTLKSGNYVIRYKTTTVYEGQPYEVETTYAVSGGNIALIASDRATVVRDDKVYMMNHTDKTIISWDVNPEKGSPERIDTNGMAYIGSKTEGGLVCEEYSTASSRLKLYFKEKELVKMEARINKEDMIMNIVAVDKTAPDSFFEVPVEYQITYI
ncbi:MAG TPA: hypothetical protein VN381_04910 [Anaerovoracaceae bacterium]|nr:hypothetical protein [Anaerovoracaceae bacterium]